MSTVPERLRLDRVRVVDAAIDLADQGGLDAASMRGVAEQLGVTPMALYKHVANRSALVDEMLDRVLDGIVPTPAGSGWVETVRARVWSARAVLHARPWVREAIESRPLATPGTLAHLDSLMAAMFDGGLDADLVHHAMHALGTRAWGLTRDVLPTPGQPEDPADAARALSEFATSYPAIVRMATTAGHAGAGCDDDAEFAFALDLLLDGIERLRVAGWRPST